MLSTDMLSKPEAISKPAAARLDIDEAFNWEFWKGDWPFWKHALSGSCAGVMEHIVMFPLDTVKTRVQAMKISFLRTRNGSGPVLNSVSGVTHTLVSGSSSVESIYASSSFPSSSATTSFTNSASRPFNPLFNEGVQTAIPGSSSTATASIPKISSNWNQGNIFGSHWMNRSFFSFRPESFRAFFFPFPGRGELTAAVNGLVSE
ncbi:hypothetical protein IE077_003554, partial [Cardiosporidium cionae]